MADLHARLVAELDRAWEVWAPKSQGEVLGRIRLAARAVVELHAPEGPEDRPTCKTCVVLVDSIDDAGAWTEQARPAPSPCSTIQAIADQLGVDGG